MSFTSASDIVHSIGYKAGTTTDRLVILDAVWEKEAGGFSKHWKLSGVKRGVLYVAPSSPAAAQELQLRGPSLIRSLNKYFKSAWIKSIRAAR